MNKACIALWNNMSEDIGKHHPDFSVDKMLGGKLGKFIENKDDRKSYVAPLTGSKILKTNIAEHHL